MSRIGKIPVTIPAKVKVEVKDRKVSVEGPKGKLNWVLPLRTSAKVENNSVVIARDGDDAEAKALHGLSRALINNMVNGVSEGYVKKLEIQGVGFKDRSFYQLALVTPGINPFNAPSRKVKREQANLRIYAWRRPLIEQRFTTRVGLPSRGTASSPP